MHFISRRWKDNGENSTYRPSVLYLLQMSPTSSGRSCLNEVNFYQKPRQSDHCAGETAARAHLPVSTFILRWNLFVKSQNKDSSSPPRMPFSAGNKWSQVNCYILSFKFLGFGDRPRLSSVTKLFQADPLLSYHNKMKDVGPICQGKAAGSHITYQRLYVFAQNI